jgi:hypothetical protein
MPRNVNAVKQKEVEERMKKLNNSNGSFHSKNEEEEGEKEGKLMKNLSKSKPYRPQMNPSKKEEPVIIIDKELLNYSDDDDEEEYSYEEDENEVESSSARSSPAKSSPVKKKKKSGKPNKKEQEQELDVKEVIRQLALEQEQIKAELEAEKKRKEEKLKKKPEKQKKKEYVQNIVQVLAEDYNIRKNKKETFDKMIGNTRGQLMSAVKF